MKESFELRRYQPIAQSNLFVGEFERLTDRWHSFESIPVGSDNVIFQVYPHDPTKCFYQPLPVGMSWFLVGNPGEQLLATVDHHDHYAFFSIPSKIERLDWIMAPSFKEALLSIKKQ